MNMLDKVAKALHDHLASSGPRDGHKRYWETAPGPVKDFNRGLAVAALAPVMEEIQAIVYELCAADTGSDEYARGARNGSAAVLAALSEKDS